jgi:hypothetical protein
MAEIGGTIPNGSCHKCINNLKDYVYWDTYTGGSKDNAGNAVSAKLWSGDCVAEATNGSIARKPGTNGESKNSYDPTAEDGVRDCSAIAATKTTDDD